MTTFDFGTLRRLTEKQDDLFPSEERTALHEVWRARALAIAEENQEQVEKADKTERGIFKRLLARVAECCLAQSEKSDEYEAEDFLTLAEWALAAHARDLSPDETKAILDTLYAN